MLLLRHLDAFAGIGGFSLAARQAGGIETVQFIEIDPNAQAILRRNFPGIPCHSDIKTFTPDAGQFDLITGGFPCQDLSCANARGRGLAGARSGLWWQLLRIIQQSKPTWIVLENVPPTRRHPWTGIVQSNLSDIGYKSYALELSARQFGGLHLRRRVYVVAYPSSLRCFSTEEFLNRISSQSMDGACRDWQDNFTDQPLGDHWRVPKPRFLRKPDGLSRGLDDLERERIRLLGNSIYVPCAKFVLEQILAAESNSVSAA